MRYSVIIFLGLFIFGCNKSNVADGDLAERLFHDVEYQILSQDESERSINYSLRDLQVFSLGEIDMYKPEFLVSDHKGNFSLFDYGTMNLIFMEYDHETNNFSDHRTAGEGRGRGPFQFQNPVDYKYDTKSEKFWLLDANNAKLIKFDSDAEDIETIDTKAIKHRFALLGENKIVYKSSVDSDGYLFEIYDHGTGESRKVGKHQNISMYYTEGFMDSNDSLWIYMPIGVNRLYAFRSDGSIKYAVETMHQNMQDLIRANEIFSGEISFNGRPEDFSYINSRMVIHEDRIYSLYAGDNSRLLSKTIDVYNLDDGSYLHSITSDNYMLDIVIQDDYVIARTVNDDSEIDVTVFEWVSL